MKMCKNSLLSSLFEIMDKKKTNLAVSVDLTISEEILKVSKCNSQKIFNIFIIFSVRFCNIHFNTSS